MCTVHTYAVPINKNCAVLWLFVAFLHIVLQNKKQRDTLCGSLGLSRVVSSLSTIFKEEFAVSYPKDLLSTRAVVKPGLYAVIPKDGLVNNTLPYLTGCRTSIVASPKMGASFVQYVCHVQPNGGTTSPFAKAPREESFLYVISGEVDASSEGSEVHLTAGGYLYAPPAAGISFSNNNSVEAKILLYKQLYIPCDNKLPYFFSGNVNNIEYRDYEDMANVHIKDLLPVDLNFDMNMHILSFDPGGCHPIVETHVQEHGMYILEGEGMYLLDNLWMGIKEEDFIWFGAYAAQCAYGVGLKPFTYIYSKDCNRDVSL